jgi:hypothetical protein
MKDTTPDIPAELATRFVSYLDTAEQTIGDASSFISANGESWAHQIFLREVLPPTIIGAVAIAVLALLLVTCVPTIAWALKQCTDDDKTNVYQPVAGIAAAILAAVGLIALITAISTVPDTVGMWAAPDIVVFEWAVDKLSGGRP